MSRVVETAQTLVRIPSVNPAYDPASAGEGAVVSWIEGWAMRNHLEVRADEVLPGRRNLLLTLRNAGGGQAPHFLFAGHTDTVAVGGMEIPPFSGTIANGRLSGRGSADMKGPLAAMLHALLALREQRASWEGTVSVACVVDEEYLARGIKALMARADSRFDFAVVGEPTQLGVVNGCKGCLRFTFEAVGRSGHSSAPGLGRNAIVAMSEAILALDRYFDSELRVMQRPGFGSSTGSVGLVNGGTGINIVPEACRASVDIRLLPGQSWREIYDGVQTCVSVQASRVPDIVWKFEETPFVDPAFETDPQQPLVRAALAGSGQQDARVVAFSCDASKIAAAGVPCIILGPGDIAEAHTSRESIGVDEIDLGAQRYAELAQRLLPRTSGSTSP